jgi:hypothetical protein
MAEFGLFDKIKISVLEITEVETCKETSGNRVELLYRFGTKEEKKLQN